MQRWRACVVALALAGVALSGCQTESSSAAGGTSLTDSSTPGGSATAAVPTVAPQSASSTLSQAAAQSSPTAASTQKPPMPATKVPACPARLKAAPQSENPLPPVNGISSRLVPATPVKSALLCSYLGTNMDPIADQRLSASRTLTSGLSTMVQDLRWLPPRIDGQSVNCTAMGGPQTNFLLALILTDGTTAWVAAAEDPNSCVQASNGTFTAFANIGSELAATMKTGQWPGRKIFPGDPCAGTGRYGQQSRLVPAGAVGLDICRSTGGPFQTIAHVTGGFGALVDALNGKPTTTSTNSCSISTTGLTYNLTFRYASGPPVEVRYIKGCVPAIDNSSLQSTDDGHLIPQIEELIPALKRLTSAPSAGAAPTSPGVKSTR